MKFCIESKFNLAKNDFFNKSRNRPILKISTFKGFRHYEDKVIILNKLFTFLDTEIRMIGESIQVFIKRNEDFYSIIDRVKDKTPFYNCIDNPMTMIKLLTYDSSYESITPFLIWDGLDSDMGSQIEFLASHSVTKQFFVYNLLTDEVHDKWFYKRFVKQVN